MPKPSKPPIGAQIPMNSGPPSPAEKALCFPASRAALGAKEISSAEGVRVVETLPGTTSGFRGRCSARSTGAFDVSAAEAVAVVMHSTASHAKRRENRQSERRRGTGPR